MVPGRTTGVSPARNRKETVLDAIAQINGLTAVSSKQNIWVARPGLAPDEADLTMAVNWNGLTQKGETATNYQLRPATACT